MIRNSIYKVIKRIILFSMLFLLMSLVFVIPVNAKFTLNAKFRHMNCQELVYYLYQSQTEMLQKLKSAKRDLANNNNAMKEIGGKIGVQVMVLTPFLLGKGMKEKGCHQKKIWNEYLDIAKPLEYDLCRIFESPTDCDKLYQKTIATLPGRYQDNTPSSTQHANAPTPTPPHAYSNAGSVHCPPGDEICCFSHAFKEGGPAAFQQCVSSGGNFGGSEGNFGEHGLHFPNEDTAAAGAIAALLMLIASLGLNTSMLAAQEATLFVSEGEGEKDDPAQPPDTSPSLVDPYDGEAFPEENGMYWDGYGERWMTREEAEHFVSELNREKSEEDSRREQELDDFEEQNERERVQRNADREQRLRDEGNVYDEEQDAWVRDPDYVPPRTDLEEFYDQIDYIDEHRHEFTDAQNENIDRIIQRTGYQDATINETDLSEEDKDALNGLSHTLHHILQNRHMAEALQAQADEARYAEYELIASDTAWIGKQCAETVELYLTAGRTKGAITSFIYETAEKHDKPFTEIIKNSTLRSAETYVGNYLGDKVTSIPGKVAVNTAWGSAMERGDQYMSGNYDNTKTGLKGAENASTDYLRGELKDYASKSSPQYLRNIRADSIIHNLSKQSISELRAGFNSGSTSRFNDLVRMFKKI